MVVLNRGRESCTELLSDSIKTGSVSTGELSISIVCESGTEPSADSIRLGRLIQRKRPVVAPQIYLIKA